MSQPLDFNVKIKYLSHYDPVAGEWVVAYLGGKEGRQEIARIPPVVLGGTTTWYAYDSHLYRDVDEAINTAVHKHGDLLGNHLRADEAQRDLWSGIQERGARLEAEKIDKEIIEDFFDIDVLEDEGKINQAGDIWEKAREEMDARVEDRDPLLDPYLYADKTAQRTNLLKDIEILEETAQRLYRAYTDACDELEQLKRRLAKEVSR